jgi:hypothetical protein
MGTLLAVVIAALMTVGAAPAQTGSTVSVTSDGWSLTADAEQGVLRIALDNLGTVMKEVRLNLQGERDLLRLKNWSVEKKGQSQLSIITSQPQTAWLFEVGPNTLKISSTSADAILTAEAPASMERIVARVLDPQGVPVTWQGSHAIATWGDYGGSETWNPSLPSQPKSWDHVLCFRAGVEFESAQSL